MLKRFDADVSFTIRSLIALEPQGKKYLMRIINTSVDTTYIFAIDNHNFTVISSDFVPIVPYNATNVTVAIGMSCQMTVKALY